MAIWQIIIVAMLISLSSIAKAIQDKLSFHFSTSVFKNVKNPQYWNPAISHRNKWKNGNKINGEKFLGSSTILVGLTDAWHLFGFIRNFLIVNTLPIITLNPWFLLSYPVYIIVFHVFFTWIFKKN